MERTRAALLAREQEARATAEDANRTKDDFLAALSHELRCGESPATLAAGRSAGCAVGFVSPGAARDKAGRQTECGRPPRGGDRHHPATLEGGNQSYHGRYFTVENVRLYSLPDSPPRLYAAVGGRHSTELAGCVGDGLIGTDPEASLLAAFDSRRRRRQAAVRRVGRCWAKDEAAAKRIATEQWPTRSWRAAFRGSCPAAALRGGGRARDGRSRGGVHRMRPRSHRHSLRRFASTLRPAAITSAFTRSAKDQKGFFQFYAEESCLS
jgi:hypothetical protein